MAAPGAAEAAPQARHRLDPGGDRCAGARAGHGAESARDLSRLNVLLQRFLLVLVFLNAPVEDVADRDQADDAVAFEHGQMAELAIGHHFHDGGNGIVLPAADDLARHHLADRPVQHAGSPLTHHAHDIALRQDALDAAIAHHKHGADLALAKNLDRRRKLRLRLDAQDVVALGIENCTYRHWRLLEVGRAIELARSCLFQVINQQSGARAKRTDFTPAWGLMVSRAEARGAIPGSRPLLQLTLTAPREEAGREVCRI